MKVIDRNISELIPAEYNPRYISDEALEHLKASIQRFDAVEPVLVNVHPDRKNIIISGHQRIKAAKSLGLETFPCVELSLDKDKERELNIRMNKNTGGWDWDELATYFDVDELTEWGFTDDELFKDGTFEEEPEAVEDDYETPDEIETDFVLGDLIEIGEHRLLCGDSTDSDQVAKLMGGEKADMGLTDPPYNVAYEGKTKEALTIQNDRMDSDGFSIFLQESFKSYFIEMKEGSPIYVFCPLEDGVFLRSYLESGLKLQSILVWVKNTIVMGRKDYHYKHEPILYGWKEGSAHKWYGGRDKQTVIECNKPPRNGEHPTMKPIELLSGLLENSSKSKNIILDLFLGSGSTMVACHQLNRKCYGMELDPKYCQVIVDRMCKLDESLEIKVNGSKYVKTGEKQV